MQYLHVVLDTVIRSKDWCSTSDVVFIFNFNPCILLSFYPASTISDTCFVVRDSNISARSAGFHLLTVLILQCFFQELVKEKLVITLKLINHTCTCWLLEVLTEIKN